jgi:phosphomethylpyrimidine synthase
MCGPKFCAYKITQNIMEDQESIQEIIKENEESEK